MHTLMPIHSDAKWYVPQVRRSGATGARSMLKRGLSLILSDTPVVSGQWSVVSGQWSVVSGQWSVVSGQWSVVSGQWSVVSGQCGQAVSVPDTLFSHVTWIAATEPDGFVTWFRFESEQIRIVAPFMQLSLAAA